MKNFFFFIAVATLLCFSNVKAQTAQNENACMLNTGGKMSENFEKEYNKFLSRVAEMKIPYSPSKACDHRLLPRMVMYSELVNSLRDHISCVTDYIVSSNITLYEPTKFDAECDTNLIAELQTLNQQILSFREKNCFIEKGRAYVFGIFSKNLNSRNCAGDLLKDEKLRAEAKAKAEAEFNLFLNETTPEEAYWVSVYLPEKLGITISDSGWVVLTKRVSELKNIPHQDIRPAFIAKN